MCGIIGRISPFVDSKKTFDGLKALEYRGYDSFGVLLYDKNKKVEIFEKNVGEFDLNKYSSLLEFDSHIEIGHTRWATHGGVSLENAHPHFDSKKEFFVVMNGIVENYLEVKKELVDLGYEFVSQTDTEIIPILYSHYFEKSGDVLKSLLSATRRVVDKLSGEFSFLLKYKNYVVGYKNINPIIVGKSDREIFVSSDSNLVQSHSDVYYVLEDEEMFVSCVEDSCFDLKFFDESFCPISKTGMRSEFDSEKVEKETKFFMEKEVLEQKKLRDVLSDDNMKSLGYLLKKSKSQRLVFVGAGTSYHAALNAHYVLLKMGICSDCVLASELRNYSQVFEGCLIVVFSQSGETADLIFPLKELVKRNEVFTITNTKGSTLDRMSERSVYLNCGKEVAVASTKAFTFQVFVMDVFYALSIDFDLSLLLNIFESDFDSAIRSNEFLIDELCDLLCHSSSFFFLGRDKYYPFAIEGALKLKEISYIHAEGFAGGELKHGTLALIEEGVPVIVLDDSKEIVSNAIEVKSRGGLIIGISDKDNDVYDFFLKVPTNFKKFFVTILMQLFALRMSEKLGLNPDKPRNLAKSVTVK